MYEYIKGKLAQMTPSCAVVDANGIGYKILIPTSAFSQLPQAGEAVLLYTSFIVREASQTLFGFMSAQERDLFESVLHVSGIGPKIALSLIGHLPIDDFYRAVNTNDVAAISRVPGIGKKTAERVVIDMRDKFSTMAPAVTAGAYAVSLPDHPERQKVTDALSALMNLGYNQMIAQKAVKIALQELSEEAELSSLITLALKNV